MPALAETQIAFLLRDIENGLVPKCRLGEPLSNYYSDLSTLYFLPKEQIQALLEAQKTTAQS